MQYLNTEQLAEQSDGRKTVYDLYCKTDTGEYLIVEMQNSGTEKRTIPSEASRKSYVTEDRISTLERGGGGADPASIPASASIDSSGLIEFDNSGGTALFTLQLPIYNGGVS